jgi:ABC-2 type transport system permease protein
VLAVAVRGTFESFFKDAPSPFLEEETATETSAEGGEGPATEGTTEPDTIGLIETSPSTAQLIVVGSAEFLNDTVLQISNSLTGDRYLNNLLFVENGIDWFTEDTALASIRAGGAATRVLKPISESEQTRWEVLNYIVALVSVVALGVIWRIRKRGEKPMQLLDPQHSSQSTENRPAYQGGD